MSSFKIWFSEPQEMEAGMMEKEIFIRGRKITYFDDGEGFPFLIIHGWGPWTSQPPYAKFRKLLVSQGYRVIFPVLPGFWEGWLPTHSWGMDEYLECVLGFIEEMKLEKFFLFGHSFGGAMSIRLASSYPERIKALILLTPAVFRPFRFIGINFERPPVITIGFLGYWLLVRGGEILLSFFLAILKKLRFFSAKVLRFGKARDWLERQVDKAFENFTTWLEKLRPQYRFFFERRKLMAKIFKNVIGVENTLPYLSEIRQPTLVIWGERDSFLFWFAGRFMGRIPDYDFKIIPGVGHNPQEDTPEKVVELIGDFIKKLKDKEKVTPKE